MDQKQSLQKLLRQMASTLERASSGDVEALLSGQAEFVISGRDIRHSEKKDVGQNHRILSSKLEGLVSQLKTLDSRDGGLSLLVKADLTKKELEKLARLMDLPVLREDDSEKLRLKIVEQSIGARLNSLAIRG